MHPEAKMAVDDWREKVSLKLRIERNTDTQKVIQTFVVFVQAGTRSPGGVTHTGEVSQFEVGDGQPDDGSFVQLEDQTL